MLLEMKPIKSPSLLVLITRKHVLRDCYILHTYNLRARQHVPLLRHESLSYHLQSIQPPINQILSIHIKNHQTTWPKKRAKIANFCAPIHTVLFLVVVGKKCVALATGAANPYIEGDRWALICVLAVSRLCLRRPWWNSAPQQTAAPLPAKQFHRSRPHSHNNSRWSHPGMFAHCLFKFFNFNPP
jgi:hypothetical protein